MKKIISNLLKHKINLILLVVLFIIFCVSNSACIVKSSITAYDSQELLVWKYLAGIGNIPYRDFHYPYGIINFLKDQNIFIFLLFNIISSVCLFFIYLIFKNIFKNSWYSLVLLISFIIFGLGNAGILAFVRYEVFICFSLFVAYLIFKYNKINFKFAFLIGVVLGLLCALFFDQGIYTAFAVIGLICFKKFKLSKFTIQINPSTVRNFFVASSGFIVGMSPLYLYLLFNNALGGVYNLFLDLKDLAYIAKTPFFVFVFSENNIFILLLLIFSIVYLIFRLINSKEKSIQDYLIFCLVFIILVLENKSVVRSLDVQILLPSFLLFFILISVLKHELSNVLSEKKQFLLYCLIILSVFFGLGLGTNKSIINEITVIINNQNLGFGNNCYAKQLVYIKNSDIGINQVLNSLGVNDQNKVYVYPDNPVFYALFKQKFPFYNTIYEASSNRAQNILINYLLYNKVKYVIINKVNLAIQDNVPNYARGSVLFPYILNNYLYKEQIGNFLILKKQSNADNFVITNEYFKNLLSVDLGNIPRSEGEYKSKYLDFNKADSKEINSDRLFLVLRGLGNNSDYSSIEVKTKQGLSTVVRFKSCGENKNCIIDVSKIPLFYKVRDIGEINYKGNYKLFLIKNSDNHGVFW
jgi:hypothetical protein